MLVITLDEHLEHLNHKYHSISTYCANKQTWCQQNNKPVEMNVISIQLTPGFVIFEGR